MTDGLAASSRVEEFANLDCILVAKDAKVFLENEFELFSVDFAVFIEVGFHQIGFDFADKNIDLVRRRQYCT